jgi:hypothetical protein
MTRTSTDNTNWRRPEWPGYRRVIPADETTALLHTAETFIPLRSRAGQGYLGCISSRRRRVIPLLHREEPSSRQTAVERERGRPRPRRGGDRRPGRTAGSPVFSALLPWILCLGSEVLTVPESR